MTYTFKLARRLAVLRHLAMFSLLLLLAACSGDSTAPDTKPSTSPSDVASLQVIPRSVTIEASQRVQFRGQIQDTTGEMIATRVAWEATGGNIDSTGTFWSSNPGTYRIIARRRWDAPLDLDQPRHGSRKDIDAWRSQRHHPVSMDTSVVLVVPASPKLQRLAISPKPIRIKAGHKHHFKVTGYFSNDSAVAVGVTWSATGGAIDPSGDYTAGTAPGTFKVIAANTAGTLADTAGVTITALSNGSSGSKHGPNAPPSQQLASVVLTPALKTLLTGTNVQYQAYGRTNRGDSVSVTVGFSATGGTITSSGLFTAGSKTGTFKVIARDSVSSMADTAQLTVFAPTAPGASPMPPSNFPPPVATGPQLPAGTGIPFGPFNLLDGAQTSRSGGTSPFSMSMDPYTASNLVTRLNDARARGMRLMIAMTSGKHSNYRTDGVFDIAKWKAKMDSYNTPEIQRAIAAAVADGTIIGNEVMDEPQNTTRDNTWGPRGTMTKARVDGLCAYVKNMFPTLPVGVTHDHNAFEPQNSYQVCDYILSQYRWSKTKGNIAAFRDGGLALARRDRIAIAFSLNIIDGGEPGEPCAAGGGTRPGLCRMTPTEVRDWGLVLGPAGCALTMWHYDAGFMANPEYLRAFRDVGDLLARTPGKSCRRT
jgi:hypothetical protein